MFTGIVQNLSPVIHVSDAQGIRRLELSLGDLSKDLKLGASVAVNGVCLTAVAVTENRVCFDVIGETLNRTNLGLLNVGDVVNVERSFRVGDEVGGHMVSGHATGVVTVATIVHQQRNRTLTFTVSGDFMPFLMHKGFVALNGASLTISELDRKRNTLSVSLIPETLARTNFGTVQVGDKINIEVDAQTRTIVETVRNLMSDPLWSRKLVASEDELLAH